MTAPDPAVPAGGEELSSAERELLAAAGAGKFLTLRPESIDLLTELADRGDMDKQSAGRLWTDDQTIHAEVITGLLDGTRLADGDRPRAVMLRGARITGSLDLRGVTLTCPLWLWDCWIDQPVTLNDATAPSIGMPGCRVLMLVAARLRTARDLILNDKFTAIDGILLRDARVDGGLDLSGARVARLSADGLAVEQDMLCTRLDSGEVCLARARIAGQLDLSGATLGDRGTVLAAAQLSVGSSLICDGLTAEGGVELSGAHIGGQVRFSGAKLVNGDGTALASQGITIGHSLSCDRLTAEGGIDMGEAHISGQVNMNGAKLRNTRGWALSAGGLVVGSNMTCEEDFRARGGIRMLGAHIGSQLNLNGAHLSNPGGQALSADGLTVDMSMSCAEGFTAHGEVCMIAAHIGLELTLAGASLNNAGGIALNLARAQTAALHLTPAHSPAGAVLLDNAKVGSLDDDPTTWPAHLGLRGFAYDRLANTAVTVGERMRWLDRVAPGGYAPQVYDQLVATYRRAGNEEAARKIAIAKQRRRRAVLNPAGKVLSLVLDWTVGYGYRTWQAGVWLAVLIPLSTWAFSRIHMIAGAAHPSAFNPLGYSLDLLIPIADLGLKSDWQASGDYLYLTWLLRAIGWILTTAVVAAVTGVLKRD